MAPPNARTNVETALRRIAERDKLVRAWLHVDDLGALSRAAALDALHAPIGPLHGVAIGVKDVFDTADMPTTHNSPLFSGHRPARDAACIATLRAAGAIILGKTDTTEFAAAGRDAVSANPLDLTRTPGGSSAGSAAAVTDGHVRIALATQTGGSTIRPASFCGIHGFKPTWGTVSREGVKLYANSLDTVGWHARSIDDCEVLCAVFGMAPGAVAARPLRLALCRTPFWDAADGDAQAALLDTAARLATAGAMVEEPAWPEAFAGLNDAHHAILWREGAAAFRDLAVTRGDLLHADFHARVASTEHIADATLRAAYDLTATARMAFERIAHDYDAVLALSAPGVASIGRAPGRPVLNQLWTLMHVPVLSLPIALGEGKLPIGISLIGPRFSDRVLCAVGRRIEALLG